MLSGRILSLDGTVSCQRRIRGPWLEAGSGDSPDAGYLSPGLERPSTGAAMISGIGVGRAAKRFAT